MSSASASSTKYVDMSDPQYDEILAGIRKSYANSCVLWIEEVQNEELERAYLLQKNDLLSLRGKDVVKELRLYHGTNEAAARMIIRDGFDPSVNRKSVYGKGTYFARDASYSISYAPPSGNDEVSYVLICDVLVGKTKTYGSNQTIDTTLHDNSADQMRRIFVTPYRYGAIPRYLIAFYKNV